MSGKLKAAKREYSVLPTAEERQDARDWLAGMLAVLGAGRMAPGARPEVVCLRQGYGKFQAGRSTVGGPLCLAGKVYASGFGTHGVSDVRVRLPAGGRRLTGLCGIDDSERTRTRTADQVFSVEVNGKEVWNSGPRQVSSPPARFTIALGGQREFLLKVRGPESYADVDWVNLQATLIDGKTAELSEVVDPVGEVFSFRYGGKASATFLDDWRLETERLPERDGIVVRRITRTDPRTGLAVLCEVKEYRRFPVIEWVVRLKNTSKRKSPLIENVLSMDFLARRGELPYLHYSNGDYCAPDSFEPFRAPMAHDEEYRFASAGGRGTNHAWPWYNLEWPDCVRGLVAVVGWPGQWASRLRGLKGGLVHISAGQELTHFRLLPGEEVRTPLSVVMFYRGNRERSQNLWRRWMVAHSMPRTADGRIPPPQIVACSSHQFKEMTQANEDNQKQFVSRYLEEGLKLDYWWMDAGWYPCGGDWPNTGTWEPDPARFPRGLRAISDHARARGVKTILWFEPERVGDKNSWLARNHPEWLLTGPDSANRLLNLGHPKALAWLTDHVDRTLREQGVDLYRQDFNMDPLEYWRKNDAPDRQGMTENLHVQGYLKYWDALRARHPNLVIDSCASGGRRDDLETMRRAVPLIRSDCLFEPTSQQCHHLGFAPWIPYHGAGYVTGGSSIGGTGTDNIDPYHFRSNMAPSMTLCFDMRRTDLNYRLARRLFQQLRQIGPFYLCDFYPLTEHTLRNHAWVAWQYNRPEEGDGVVQAFRRQDSPAGTARLMLRGLDPSATYVLTDLDRETPRKVRGKELMEQGLAVEIQAKPGAVVVLYRRAKGKQERVRP